MSRAVWAWPAVDICNLYLELLFLLFVHVVLDQAAYPNVCGLMVITCLGGVAIRCVAVFNGRWFLFMRCWTAYRFLVPKIYYYLHSRYCSSIVSHEYVIDRALKGKGLLVHRCSCVSGNLLITAKVSDHNLFIVRKRGTSLLVGALHNYPLALVGLIDFFCAFLKLRPRRVGTGFDCIFYGIVNCQKLLFCTIVPTRKNL